MSNELIGLVSEAWLRACPTGVLVTDGQRILWSNPALDRMTRGRLAQLRETADPDNEPLLQKLISTEGLLGLADESGEESWVFCETADVDAGGQSFKLRFFQDVSGEVAAVRERDELARKVEELDLTDPLTGLANPRALGNALSAQVTRSRRYQNPLSLALVKVETAPPGSAVPDGVVLGVSRFLRDRLRWADVIGRHTDDTFMLILPETRSEDLEELLASMRQDGESIVPAPPHERLKVHLHTGMAAWNKGMDVARLVAGAELDLADAMQASQSGE